MPEINDEPVEDNPSRVPRHVAIIMDGNGRWAKARGLPVIAGHRAGVEVIRRLLESCRHHGIEVLTLFAFSSENWQRSAEEVRGLMALFMRYLRGEVRKLHENGIRLRIIGNRERFAPRLRQLMQESEQLTASNQGFTLVIAADYGGQWDIAQAAQSLLAELQSRSEERAMISAADIEQRLCLSDLPRPDLLIRTGGDHRISNFLLWQIAYTELYFTESFWPDFDAREFAAAIRDYAARERRFGGRPLTNPAEGAAC